MLFTGEQFDSGLKQYYLRARYYDQGIGRFTQMDTYQGTNSDPVTLHKYLYANVDPVNNVDPSGQFSLIGASIANNIAGILVTMQIDNAFSVFDTLGVSDSDIEAGRVANKLLGLAALGAGGFQILKMLSGKFRKLCNSFEEGTPVYTEYGLRKIQDIKIGDKVWAYDEKTGEKSLQEVIHLIQREGEKEIVDISLNSGEVIHATAGHPFYVVGEENHWVDASELTLMNKLLGFDDNPLSITSLKEEKKTEKVYNFTVANAHTYFVGKDKVLVHNTQKICPIDGLLFGAEKPRFLTNPKHIKGGGGSKAGLPKGLEPSDAEYAFTNLAVKAENTGHWYAKSTDGKSIYRYFEDHQGVAHWSGGTGDLSSPLNFSDIPAAVKRAFGFKANGKLQ